jgi:hypothetical protein
MAEFSHFSGFEIKLQKAVDPTHSRPYMALTDAVLPVSTGSHRFGRQH